MLDIDNTCELLNYVMFNSDYLDQSMNADNSLTNFH